MNNKSFSLSTILRNLDLILGGISLLILVAVTFIGVFMRYLFNAPLVWGEEVQLWCSVWLVFFTAGVALRNGSHVAIEIIVDRFPLRMQKVTQVVIYVVTIAICCVFLWQSLVWIRQLYVMGRFTSILHIKYWFIYSVVPLGFALLIINCIFLFVKDLRSSFSSLTEKGDDVYDVN